MNTGKKQPVVLIMDDEVDSAESLSELLKSKGYEEVRVASSKEEAWDVIHGGHETMIAFLDIHMNAFHKGEVLKDLSLNLFHYIDMKARDRIVPYAYTCDDSDPISVLIINAGAERIIPKPINLKVTLAWMERDVKRLLSQSEEAATGLLNYRGFKRVVMSKLEKARDHPDSRHATFFSLVFVDLDRFMKINDDYGHSVGDEAIVHVAQVLKKTVRAEDDLARKSGDEFLLFLPGVDETEAKVKIRDVEEAIASHPLMLEDGTFIHLAASAGASTVARPQIGEDVETLFQSLFDQADERKQIRKDKKKVSR